MQGLLITLLVLGSVFSVGCGKKKPTQQQMVNACLFDPTGNCPRQAAAMATAMGGGAMSYNVGSGLGASYPVLAAGTNPGLIRAFSTNASGGTIKVASANDVKTQAMKVQSALAADANNPKSMYYDAPNSVPQRDAGAVAALQALPTQNQQVGLPARSPASTGDDATGAR